MKRLSREEKENIIKLRKDGKSLRYICRFLSIDAKNKSTVYYHIRKNFGRRFKVVTIDHTKPELIGEVMGLFASDGSTVPQRDYQVRFHLDANEKEYAERFVFILNELLNKMPRLNKVRKNSIVIVYKSKPFYSFIRDVGYKSRFILY